MVGREVTLLRNTDPDPTSLLALYDGAVDVGDHFLRSPVRMVLCM